MPKDTHSLSVRELCRIALCAALTALCAWLSVPTAVPFTMQTFAIFLTLELLGWRQGSLAILAYLLLGAAGLPVFSGFRGGLGILLGATGGYLLGFLAAAPVYGAVLRLWGTKGRIPAMLLGNLTCYLFGTVWFLTIYARTGSEMGLLSALSCCVFPFLLPDLCKILLAAACARVLRKHLQLPE